MRVARHDAHVGSKDMHCACWIRLDWGRHALHARKTCMREARNEAGMGLLQLHILFLYFYFC